ncbi:MAG: hypothetical protein A2445_02425 [Candidatus Jacksonbacteria bacterium RIFOXYC2_FULL_44_29]|nr:MAG: hypothetical protein A2240_02685 [Candidatus Jacksonbacteria bacterium RIFOXYA2_FULL_43_12]OGY77384.1 MAG: hypothetical protein A2295_01635 [Candidatus Jacksonbacteria bacterium RIFOXYB2_FULL_44_15]OGY78156.1 MAG: hypothetical protein A2550_05980 [Candidatus Jacksonbacteria bacterium RIFOXYD2_FULL_43_21]OGY80732.1 MAG: hypothetical protein A2445_02425 [Candidatus Jacksonbacteria bacterium RIFOXYC2_FULL_44_29]HBH46787.1 hypothetical protein [Candidatus Jacksonbacteria bacterium]
MFLNLKLKNMLLTPQQDISEHIVQALTYQPNLSLPELQKQIEPKYKKTLTPQGWYKALKKLLQNGVIIKQKMIYSLNTSWVADALRWSQTLKQNYIEPCKTAVIKLPNREKEKITYRFSSLLALNSFWAHALVYIGAQYPKNNTVYGYNPHFWFYLAHDAIEAQYNRSMGQMNAKTYLIIGSQTFLDTWNERFFPNHVRHWCSPKSLYPDETHYLNYVAGFFLDIKIDQKMAEYLHQLYANTKSLQDINQLALIDLFQKKAPCTLSISKNQRRGEAFKRKIMRHF